MTIRMRVREEAQVGGQGAAMKGNSSNSCDCVVIDSPPPYGTHANRYQEDEGTSLCRIIVIDDGDDDDVNIGETSEPKAEGEFSNSLLGFRRFSKLSRCFKSNKSMKNRRRENSDSSDCEIIEDPTEFCYKKKSQHPSRNPRNPTNSYTCLIDSDQELDSDLSASSSNNNRRTPNFPDDTQSDSILESHNGCPKSDTMEGEDDALLQVIDSIPSSNGIELPENLINQRERLKETEDYKTLMEQEWLSRQRELRIQAEEVQKMKKRKKVLMDIERRQKERLEEIRETQKRDEEDLTMKDHIRAEVRKNLHMLELTSFSMASLLQGLGIPISSHPSPSEVHSAYRKSLLKFHPDRVAKKDIFQQVEAEEKFKLICRAKEKFL